MRSLLFVPFFALACFDKDVTPEENEDNDTTDTTDTNDGDTTDTSDTSDPVDPTPSLIEPVAVGFELVAGWDEANDTLIGWMVDDGSGAMVEESPYVIVTLATADYFGLGSDATDEDRAAESCEMYAYFVSLPADPAITTNLFNWDTGVGSSGTIVAPWASYEGYLSLIGYNTETGCDTIDPAVMPDFMAPFNGMHFGVAFADLSPKLEELYADLLADDPSFPIYSQHIAINHPDGAGGYDFIAYDWTAGTMFQHDATTLEFPTQPCEDDPASECLIPVDLSSSDPIVGYTRGYAYWYEDFPNLDLTILGEGSGAPE